MRSEDYLLHKEQREFLRSEELLSVCNDWEKATIYDILNSGCYTPTHRILIIKIRNRYLKSIT